MNCLRFENVTSSSFFFILISCCSSIGCIKGEQSPRATIQAAIKAHGGEESLAKTITGSLAAKSTMVLGNVEASVSWEETFELPQRYYRKISGKVKGRDISMEYAITDGSGWIRLNGGEAKEYQGEKQPLERNWNAFLAILPLCLADGVKLEAAGEEKVDGRDAVSVKVQGKPVGSEGILFFDKKTGLMVKSRRRIQHLLSREEVEGEVVYGDFKEVSGVQYPHHITTYVTGKKVGDMEITLIEFSKKIDDHLFDKP
jgi:hypothetical protein